jgi:hypothetical protein
MLFTMAFRGTAPKTMVFFYPGLPGQQWCAVANEAAAVYSGLPQARNGRPRTAEI